MVDEVLIDSNKSGPLLWLVWGCYVVASALSMVVAVLTGSEIWILVGFGDDSPASVPIELFYNPTCAMVSSFLFGCLICFDLPASSTTPRILRIQAQYRIVAGLLLLTMWIPAAGLASSLSNKILDLIIIVVCAILVSVEPSERREFIIREIKSHSQQHSEHGKTCLTV